MVLVCSRPLTKFALFERPTSVVLDALDGGALSASKITPNMALFGTKMVGRGDPQVSTGDTTPCRMIGVTLHRHICYEASSARGPRRARGSWGVRKTEFTAEHLSKVDSDTKLNTGSCVR